MIFLLTSKWTLWQMVPTPIPKNCWHAMMQQRIWIRKMELDSVYDFGHSVKSASSPPTKHSPRLESQPAVTHDSCLNTWLIQRGPSQVDHQAWRRQATRRRPLHISVIMSDWTILLPKNHEQHPSHFSALPFSHQRATQGNSWIG